MFRTATAVHSGASGQEIWSYQLTTQLIFWLLLVTWCSVWAHLLLSQKRAEPSKNWAVLLVPLGFSFHYFPLRQDQCATEHYLCRFNWALEAVLYSFIFFTLLNVGIKCICKSSLKSWQTFASSLLFRPAPWLRFSLAASRWLRQMTLELFFSCCPAHSYIVLTTTWAEAERTISRRKVPSPSPDCEEFRLWALNTTGLLRLAGCSLCSLLFGTGS